MSTSNYYEALEIIGQAVYDYFPNRHENGECVDKDDREACDVVDSFLKHADDGYVLVQWPDSQEYMEEEWFEQEAILALGNESNSGSAAYFIPIKRIL